MLQLCANESALRSYMRQQDDEERRTKMIADRVVDLMATAEYAHDTGDHIQEAISEANQNDCIRLGKTARLGSVNLGNCMLDISFCYWHKLATDKATEEVNDEWNSCRCHGAGCRSCRESDE